MISSKLRQYFIRQNIDKYLKYGRKGEVHQINEQVASIGILTSEEFYRVEDFQSRISEYLLPSRVKTYCFIRHDKTPKISSPFFTEKDFNWKGNVVESELQNFLDTKFDLLIGYFPKKNLFLEYASILSKASFKAGFSGIHSQLFDLEIMISEDNLDGFFFELHKYLKILNKL